MADGRASCLCTRERPGEPASIFEPIHLNPPWDLPAQAALDARLVEQAQREELLRCGRVTAGHGPGCWLLSGSRCLVHCWVCLPACAQNPRLALRPLCSCVCRLARRRLSGFRAECSAGAAELAQKQGLAAELQGRLRAGGMADAALAQLVQACAAESATMGGSGGVRGQPDAGDAWVRLMCWCRQAMQPTLRVGMMKHRPTAVPDPALQAGGERLGLAAAAAGCLAACDGGRIRVLAENVALFKSQHHETGGGEQGGNNVLEACLVAAVAGASAHAVRARLACASTVHGAPQRKRQSCSAHCAPYL